MVENAVADSFDNLIEKKECSRKTPKFIKKLFAKKQKFSNKILKTKSGRKVAELKGQIEGIEKEIMNSKEKVRKKEEDKAIAEIKINPKSFYRFAKKKSVVRSKIGPFLIDGVSVREEKVMADILSKQYENICSVSMDDIKSLNFKMNLMDTSNRK